MARGVRGARSIVRSTLAVVAKVWALRKTPHTRGGLDRFDLYQEIAPGSLALAVLLPMAGAFSATALVALVVSTVELGQLHPDGILSSVGVGAVAAVLVGIVGFELLDRYLHRPVERMPATDSSDRVALRWADARVIDRDAYLGTVDEVVQDNMGWTEDHVAALRTRTLVPMAVVAAREFVAIDVATGETIGGAAYGVDQREGGAASIGCWVGPEHRGRGYGAEILRLMVAGAWRWRDGRVTLSTRVDNGRMRHLAVAAGGVELERYDHELPDGTETPSVRYGFPDAPTRPPR